MNHAKNGPSIVCGLLNIQKSIGCTSRDVVNQVVGIVGRKTRVGHAGTLDPMATGVLMVCVGKATKMIQVIHEFAKSYDAGILLGQHSDTDDSTGRVTTREVLSIPQKHQVEEALQIQTGTFMQTPPDYSAVKLSGRRAYDLARKGNAVNIKPRPVTVHDIKVVDYSYPALTLRIRCGSGTYIRSIARDLGESLGTGGLMNSLHRSEIGPFHNHSAATIESVRANFEDCLIPVEQLFCEQPQHVLGDLEIQRLRHGKRLTIHSKQPQLVAMTDEGRFAALLVQIPDQQDQFRATINWVPQWFASENSTT